MKENTPLSGDSEDGFRAIFDKAAVSIWVEDFSGVFSAIDALKAGGVADFAAYFRERPEEVARIMGLIRVLDVNDATLKMFEARDKSELLGSLPQIFTPDSMDAFIGELVSVAEGRRYYETESVLHTVQGKPIQTFFTMVLPDPESTFQRVIFSVHDITRVKAAEQSLREADRRKTEFLALLAHELRNPLAPIANAVQVIRRTDGIGEELASASEIMERQLGQLVRLVDDLLDVSRINRGKIELRKERIELARVIHHAVEAARSLVECMGHELKVTLAPEPIYLDADAARLVQAVGNLLNNACKFTESGGRISIRVERDGNDALIRVGDNGIGIAPDHQPRIFDMFTQLDTSLERTQGGLGIGLTLVKSLVEIHDGTVTVSSDGPGHGSEFVVRLPIPVESPKHLPQERAVRQTRATATRRILIVDDNRDSALSLAMLLQMSGHETHAAYDGLEAVAAAENLKPDVVLLDVSLPTLNGYEAARRIREQPWGKVMVLVALTGMGQEEDRQQSSAAGIDHHMVKPVEFDLLVKLLAEGPADG